MTNFNFFFVFAVDGNWGGWTQWTSCSVSCGNGTVMRTRACDNPAPQHGGDPCFNQASFEQVSTCFAGDCPGIFCYINATSYDEALSSILLLLFLFQ